MTASGSPPARIISRSTLLRSWRTLPGQSWVCSTAMASVADAPLRQAGRLRNLVHEMVDKCRQRPRAARRAAAPGSEPPTGGDRGPRGTGPAAISSSRLRVVEVMMRTLTSTLLVPPTRWKVWSTSTRRILFWVSRGMSRDFVDEERAAMGLFERAHFARLVAVRPARCRTARSPSAPA